MADSHHHRLVSSSPRLTGDDIASQAFPAAFRGVSEAAVRAFLRKVADEHEALRARQDELLHQVDALEARLQERPPPGVQQDPLAALGEETARVLRSAQESAEQIRQSADERARELLESAGAEARRLREEAETVAGERTRGAEEASAEMLREAERLVGELQRGAEERAAEFEAKAQADARDELETARRRAKELVAEAEVNRDRMVRELTRRKEVLELQIETLRAGRDRLLDAYRVVKRTFEEATDALRTSDTRAPSEASRRPQPVPTTAQAVAEPGPEGREPEPERGEAEPAAEEPAAEEPAAEERPDGEPAAADTTRVGSFTLGELPEEPARPAGIAGPARPLDPAERRDPAPIRVLGADPAAPPAEQAGSEAAEPEQPEAAEDAAGPEQPEEGEDAAGPEQPEEGEDAKPEEAAEPGEATAPRAGDADDAKPAPEEVEAIFARLRASHEEEPVRGDAGGATRDDDASGAGDADHADDTAAVGADEGAEAAAEAPGPEATLLGRRDEVVELHVDDLVRMVKRVLRDEQNVLLEALRRHRGVPAPDDVLPTPADQESAFADATGPIIAQACAAGAAAVRELDGGAVGDPDQHGNGNGTGSAARTRELAAALAHELMEPLRSRLTEALHEAAAMDDTDAGERVRARYREWKGQRVADAARHALGTAFVRGVFDVLPDGEPLRWVSGDPSPCADCADNSLEATRRGAEFPTGHRLPPAHAGCRCVVAPVRAGIPATA